MTMLCAATIPLVVGEYGVGDAAVRDDLNRATIVVELLLCDDVRVVTMYVAVYAYDAFDDAGNCADVVRHHDDCHPFVERV